MRSPALIRILLPVAMISVAAAVPSRAQNIAQALTNGSFETESIAITGKTATGFSTVPSWADTGAQTGTEDSGVQGSGNNSGSALQQPQSGSFFAFERGGNPGAFQITGTKLVTGETLTLTWYSLDSYQNPIQVVSLLAATSTASTFASAATVASANGSTNPVYALPAVPTGAPYYTMYTLTATVPAADAGDFVGVSTSNIGTADAGGDYLQTDNYTLAITAPVPEPRTYGMVVAGALTLLVLAWRRKQTLGLAGR